MGGGCGAFTEVQFILNKLIPDDLDGLKVLDVGFGFGFYGWALTTWKKGRSHIVGIDINPDRVERQIELGIYDEVFCKDINEWLPVESFDLIIASHVVEHLEKDDGLKLLERLQAKCRGRLIVACPEGDTLSIEMRDSVKYYDVHVSVWRARDLRQLGFKVKQMSYSDRAGRVVSWFERVWFWLRGLGQRGVLVAWWERV